METLDQLQVFMWLIPSITLLIGMAIAYLWCEIRKEKKKALQILNYLAIFVLSIVFLVFIYNMNLIGNEVKKVLNEKEHNQIIIK